jgi:2-C-methyl-D-erythritol 4-phosphate cytidylyltransferase/2-C-methyl-D-erythritol 2,4-cyclodiphosphate synthase
MVDTAPMAAPTPGPIAVLVVAGGRGLRAGGGVPKQYRTLGGESILARSLRPFLDHPAVAEAVAVIHPDDRDLYRSAAPSHPKLRSPVFGGGERQESVRLGLEALAESAPELVLIHDAVRPFASAGLIDRVVGALADHAAVLPAVPVSDTLKRADDVDLVAATVPRDRMFAAQTPQGFRFAAALAAHRNAAGHGPFTDDSAIAEAAGVAVKIVPGDAANIKITTGDDIVRAEGLIRAQSETRVGTGYDVHALGPGDYVTLGGVRIAHDRSLIGHSDADVVLHALTDAVLGAAADSDIGDHFPPSDAALAGAASDRFLHFAVDRLTRRGGAIVHLDVMILAEAPKVGPHRDAMRHRIAEICGVAIDRVSIKATTNERLGFVGRGEGIAALATATVRLPFPSP